MNIVHLTSKVMTHTKAMTDVLSQTILTHMQTDNLGNKEVIRKGKHNRIHIKHCMHDVNRESRCKMFKGSLALLPNLLEILLLKVLKVVQR
jgi:hypothetical protein